MFQQNCQVWEKELQMPDMKAEIKEHILPNSTHL